MNPLDLKARGKSLESLMGAMDEDEVKPLLTITSSSGEPGGVAVEKGDEEPPVPGDPSDLGLGEDEGEGDPFEELLKSKMKEKMGR